MFLCMCMCMYMYVCVCVYVYVNVNAYVYVYVYVCMCMCTYTCTCTCMCMCVLVHVLGIAGQADFVLSFLSGMSWERLGKLFHMFALSGVSSGTSRECISHISFFESGYGSFSKVPP